MNLPLYERLKEEVLFMLERELSSREIKTHTLSGRVKNSQSLLEKVERKRYDRPLEQAEDLVGCRVVCLFLSDLPRLREVVVDLFNVVDESDKIADGAVEAFGYMSVHFICTLKAEYSGPRYEGLGDFKFEIQCRTILMDAWANVSHYLSYKAEASIPEDLRKDFHALSGLFYVADRHFELFYGESIASRREADVAIAQQGPETSWTFRSTRTPSLLTCDGSLAIVRRPIASQCLTSSVKSQRPAIGL